MSSPPTERTLEEGVERLNSIYSEELEDSEITLRTVGYDDGYRLCIEPTNPAEHEKDFRHDLGEAHSENEMDAFIRGLELSEEIPVKAVSKAE